MVKPHSIIAAVGRGEARALCVPSVRDQPSPVSFNSLQTFGDTTGTTLAFRGPERNYRLYLDLPTGVEVYSTGLFSRFFARDPVGPQDSPYAGTGEYCYVVRG